MGKIIYLALALSVCSTSIWSAPSDKKKTAPKKPVPVVQTKLFPVLSTGYPETIKADLFLTMAGNNFKSVPISIFAESKPELITKIAEHYEDTLKKFGFTILSLLSPEDWDTKASRFHSTTGIDLGMFRMRGKDIKYILTGNEMERLSQVQFIGSRDQGALNGTLTAMYLALEISSISFNGPMATVVLTPNILIDADLKFQSGGTPLKNYLKPNYYNSEALRLEIVKLLNENAPGREPSKLTSAASGIQVSPKPEQLSPIPAATAAQTLTKATQVEPKTPEISRRSDVHNLTGKWAGTFSYKKIKYDVELVFDISDSEVSGKSFIKDQQPDHEAEMELGYAVMPNNIWINENKINRSTGKNDWVLKIISLDLQPNTKSTGILKGEWIYKTADKHGVMDIRGPILFTKVK